MRICRFEDQGRVAVGFYDEGGIVPLAAAADAFAENSGEKLALPDGDDLLPLLPPDGSACDAVSKLAAWVSDQGDGLPNQERDRWILFNRENNS